MDKSAVQGVMLAFLAYAVYACSDASVKLLAGSPEPYESVFFGAVMGLLALPFVRKPGEKLSDIFSATNRVMWLVRALAAITGSVGSVLAFTHLSMAEAFCLLFLMPTFVTILSVIFLKEDVGWRRWSAVLMGFVGVLVVLRPGFRALNIGHFGALMGGFSGAVTVVMLRAYGQKEKRVSLYGAGLLGSMVGSFVLMLPGFTWPTPMQWVWLSGYGFLAALGNLLVMLASARVAATLVAPAQYSQMIWAIIFGYLIFHDDLDWMMGLGTAIIIISGVFTFMRERVRQPKGWRRIPPVHPQ